VAVGKKAKRAVDTSKFPSSIASECNNV